MSGREVDAHRFVCRDCPALPEFVVDMGPCHREVWVCRKCLPSIKAELDAFGDEYTVARIEYPQDDLVRAISELERIPPRNMKLMHARDMRHSIRHFCEEILERMR